MVRIGNWEKPDIDLSPHSNSSVLNIIVTEAYYIKDERLSEFKIQYLSFQASLTPPAFHNIGKNLYILLSASSLLNHFATTW